MEDGVKIADTNWKATEGGISDAMVFAENGINSINLSAGYYNEHTDAEYAVLSEMRDTVKLIMQTIAVINHFYKTFEEVPHENNWSKAHYPKSNYTNYYEDAFDESVWIEESDVNGEIYIYDMGADIAIQQGDEEVLISRGTLNRIVKQLKNI